VDRIVGSVCTNTEENRAGPSGEEAATPAGPASEGPEAKRDKSLALLIVPYLCPRVGFPNGGREGPGWGCKRVKMSSASPASKGTEAAGMIYGWPLGSWFPNCTRGGLS
jgi:hypothetical protein